MLKQIRFSRATSRLLAGAACVVALYAGQARAQLITEPPTSWEVEDFPDPHFPGPTFSATNPSGVWSYGYESVLGQNFQLLTQPLQPSTYNPQWDLDGWVGGPSDPIVIQNVNPQPWDNGTYGYPYPITIPPRGVVFGPSNSCEYGVIRFTAPYTGKYKISGQFDGLDGHSVNGLEQNVTVWVLVNNNSTSPLYSGIIHTVAGLDTASFTPKVTSTLAAGSTIDFIVGCGPNNDFWFGSTGLRGVVQWTGKKHP